METHMRAKALRSPVGDIGADPGHLDLAAENAPPPDNLQTRALAAVKARTCKLPSQLLLRNCGPLVGDVMKAHVSPDVARGSKM